MQLNSFLQASLLCFAFLPLSFLPNHFAGQTAQLEAAIAAPLQEDQVFRRVNRFREKNNLNALERSTFVDSLAREHSMDMADKVVPFGHDGSDERFDLIEQEFPDANRFGENVASNRGYRNPAKVAVRGWKRSPGHRRNMLGRFTGTGVGVARTNNNKYYFTQIFFNETDGLLNMSFIGQGEGRVLGNQYSVVVDCLTAEEVALLDMED